MLVIASVIITLLYEGEWAGIDSLFLALSLFLIYYFLPLFILSFLFDQLVIKKIANKTTTYLLSLSIGLFLIGYHIIFILKIKFNFIDNLGIIINAILISPLAAFLCERMFQRTERK